MKPPVFLLPIAVVLIAGCTIPGTGIIIPWPFGNTISLENDVVVIKELSAIPSTATAPQQIRLIAVIQNQGEREFPLKIQSPSSSGSPAAGTSIADLPNYITVDLFDYCQGLFKKVEVDTNTCKNTLSAGATTAGGPITTSCKIDTLLPKESKEIIWTLEPDDKTSLITRCDLKVSVTYPYVTSGLTTVNFINSQEYSRLLATGGVPARTSTTTMGEGPVKAWFEVKDKQPIVAAGPGAGGTQLLTPVALNIQNKGAGFVIAYKPTTAAAGTDNDPKIKITSTNIFDSPFSAPQDQCSFKKDEGIKLIENKRTLPCRITQLKDCTGAPAADCVSKETTHQLTVDIAYLYEFRKEVKVTVEPPPRI